MIKAIARLIVALNSNTKKSQIAAGIAWGLLLGLIPFGNFFWIVLFLVSFFFTMHHGLKIAFMFALMALSSLIARPLDSLGWVILNLDSLKPLFTQMYNMPFVPFTQFNNTLVAGGLAAGVVLWLPLFLLLLPVVEIYRNKMAPKFRNSKIVQKIGKSPLLIAVDKAVQALGKAK